MSPGTLDQLLAGITALSWQSLVMFVVAGVLLLPRDRADYEPLLLLPIARRLHPGQPAALADDGPDGLLTSSTTRASRTSCSRC